MRKFFIAFISISALCLSAFANEPTKPANEALERNAQTLVNTGHKSNEHGSAKHGEVETVGASHWPIVHPTHNPEKNLTAKPEAVKGLAPDFFAKVSGDNTEIKWQAVQGADVYHVQVAEDPTFKWLLVNEHLYKGTTYKVTGLKAGQKYYWRVAGVKSDNNAGYIKGYYGNSMFLAQ